LSSYTFQGKNLTTKAASMLLIVLMASAYIIPTWNPVGGSGVNSIIEEESDTTKISFPLKINVKTSGGELEKLCKIFVYRLDQDKTRLIKRFMGSGSTEVTLTVEKIEYRPVSKLTRNLIENSSIYKNINLRILAVGMMGWGSRAVSIDPAEIEESGMKGITIIEEPYPNIKSLTEEEFITLWDEEPELVVSYETWRMTHIVTFHSWDNIGAYFLADVGSKATVATRVRNWIENGITGELELYHDWHDGGESVITTESLDRFPNSGYKYGRKRYEMWWELKYRYERWRLEVQIEIILHDEYVFAVDTNLDPRGAETRPSEQGGEPLDGSGVSDPWNHGNYIWRGQNRLMTVQVKGHEGEALRWTISVGFGGQFPPGVSISVSLTVWKEKQDPSPMRVYLSVGTHSNPDYRGYAYDDNTEWMIVYLTWAP